MKRIAILGSTGSIGANALDVIRRHPERFKVVGLAADSNYKLLSVQAKIFGVRKIAINNKYHFEELKKKVIPDVKIYCGTDGISEIAALKEADMVLVAVSGTSSIKPLIHAIKARKDIALASKEALVSAGEIVMKLVRKEGVSLLPVDSEHSAIFQCLEGHKRRCLKKVYLTGTGGPLRKVNKSFFDRLPISRIIKHPKWKMGRKITVDSATLMNKGLEVIEARWLFDINPKQIEVLLHPEAVIHSMVEFCDGTIMANLFFPDMRIPIFYALTFPERAENRFPRIDFFKTKTLTFEKPKLRKFPALSLAYESLKKGPSACAVLNAANEEAVSLFLKKRIKFTKIVDVVEKVLKMHRVMKHPSLRDILALDRWAKEEAGRFCAK